MAVAKRQPDFGHVALAGQIGGRRQQIAGVQQHNQRDRRGADGEKRVERAAQIKVFGGQHGHDQPDPEDVVAVEMHPPRNEVERAGHRQLPPGVAGAEQDLGTPAEEGRPVERRGQHPLHPGPGVPRHAVAEGDADLVAAKADREQNLPGAQPRCRAPGAEQQVRRVPEPGQRAPAAAPAGRGRPQRQRRIHPRRQHQRQQQSIGKTKHRKPPHG